VLNVTYPLLPDEVARFCAGRRAVLVVEEGQPAHLEEAINSICGVPISTSRTFSQGHPADGRRIYREVMLGGLGRFCN